MATANLDARDRGLLSLLRANARTSVADMAKQLGVSRATVQARMKKLERAGVIVGYTVRLGAEIEAAQVRAMMLIRVESAAEAKIISALRGSPNVSAVHHTTGRWDVIAEIQAENLASFNKIVGALRLIDGIKATETNLLLETYQ